MASEQTELRFEPAAQNLAPGIQPIQDLPDELLDVIEYLRQHCQGPDNAATARRIGEDLGFPGKGPGREVRRLISLYKASLPFVVCGAPGAGFFVTQDPEHMAHWERTQWATVLNIFANIKAFRRLAKRHGFTHTGSRTSTHYQHAQPF